MAAVTAVWNQHSRGQDHHPELPDFHGWDTHNDIFESLRDHLLPWYSRAIARPDEIANGRPVASR